MKTPAQIKAQKKWEAKRKRQGDKWWKVLTSLENIARLKKLYEQLKTHV
jgi:hypothetical protein